MNCYGFLFIFQPQFDHNLRTPDGNTPLMVACSLGKYEVVKYLLQSAVYNLDQNMKDVER